MDIEKICRTCLTLSGPLLSIFDGESEQCLATMLNYFTTSKTRRSDNLPEKVCLACISEINRCYSFKMKCENSNRTLRQLLPDALPEEPELKINAAVSKEHKAVQTERTRAKAELVAIGVQTNELQRPEYVDREMQTTEVSTAPIPVETLTIAKSKKSTIKNFITKQPKVEVQPQSVTRASARLKLKAENISPPKEKVERKRRLISSTSTELEIKDDPLETSSTDIQELNEDLMHEEFLDYNEDDADDVSNQNSIDLPPQQKVDDQTIEAPQSYIIYEDCMITSTDKNTHYEYMLCSDENGETTFVSKSPPTTSSTSATVTETEEVRKKSIFKKEYTCSSCSQTFVSLKTLERHKLKWHSWKIVNETGVEEDTSVLYLPEARQKMIKEIQQQVDVNLFEDLPKVTEVQIVMPKPMVIEAKPVGSQFFCECGAGFAGQTALSIHRKKNACQAKAFQCNECQRMFISEEMLNQHKESHVLSHMCIDCHSLFETPEDLSEHMVTNHKRKMCNQCTICKKVFTMLSALKDHMRVHSGEKPFLCTFCGKSFTQNANLRQHVRRHTKNKPYKCDLCSKAYVTKSELISHKRTHTRDAPYKCEQCFRSYTTPSSLIKHRRSHTGERPYGCEYCPSRFATLNVLKNHVRTHTGERPYKCNFCNRAFKQQGDCRLHQQAHALKNTYVCYICNAKSPNAAQARHHAKKHHSDKSKVQETSDQNTDEETTEILSVN